MCNLWYFFLGLYSVSGEEVLLGCEIYMKLIVIGALAHPLCLLAFFYIFCLNSNRFLYIAKGFHPFFPTPIARTGISFIVLGIPYYLTTVLAWAHILEGAFIAMIYFYLHSVILKSVK